MTVSAGRIHKLKEDVIKRIAAGEVIERPASVVRELIDNSLDAQSTKIHVYLEQGGVGSIRVVDNGIGMSEEEAKIAFLSHTTSKIRQIEDLKELSTLGFRGEALASLAHCSRLNVTTRNSHSELAVSLDIQDTAVKQLSYKRQKKGTVITVKDLFFSVPARKKFLKAPSAESAQVRRVFEEKAFNRPSVEMKLFYNGEKRLDFPHEAPFIRALRVAQLLGYEKQFWHFDSKHSVDSIQTSFIVGKPSIHRRDRKNLIVYINGRFIQDYTFTKTLEMAYREFLPPGLWPVCFVFLEILPQKVDFNVHPTKKDMRLAKEYAPKVQDYLATTLRSFLDKHAKKRLHSLENREQEVQYLLGVRKSPATPWDSKSLSERNEVGLLVTNGSAATARTQEIKFRYLGQLMRVFLLFEKEDSLFILDQHAAHERILFDRFTYQKFQHQALIIPYRFKVTSEIEPILKKRLSLYQQVGIHVHPVEGSPLEFEIRSVPIDSLVLGQDIIDLIQDQEGSLADIKRKLFANLACKSAIKEGAVFPPDQAVNLIKETFNLDNAHCPHGRPVFVKLSRGDLYKFLQRKI